MIVCIPQWIIIIIIIMGNGEPGMENGTMADRKFKKLMSNVNLI